jgi:hypothetical protein
MEVVRLGDVNVDAYTTAMESIKGLVPKLKKVDVEVDGLGLEERLVAKKARVDGAAAQMVVQYNHQVHRAPDAISLDAVPPSKNRSGGRPTSSCDKPSYKTTSKRTRFCTICRLPGTRAQPAQTALQVLSKMLELRVARHRKTAVSTKKNSGLI